MDIYNNTIHSIIEKRVLETPLAIAAVFGDQSISYDELNKKANQLAYYLRELGVGPDVYVVICMDRSIDFLIGVLGILKAGGAYVPLDPSHPEKRLLSIIQDHYFSFLITTSAYQYKFLQFLGHQIFIDNYVKLFAIYEQKNPNFNIKSNELAYIIFTSGSTGKPKGVLIEHINVLNYADWFLKYTNIQPQTRVDWSCNNAFDMAITTSIVALMQGVTIIICSDEIKKNIQAYLNYLVVNQINLIKITPTYLKELLHEIEKEFINLSFLNTLILGGERLHRADCIAWLTHYPNHRLFNEYGPTETTVGASQFLVTRDNCESLDVNVPIGKPALNTIFYILNKNLHPVMPDEMGELYIGGCCVGRGYLDQPVLTTKKFIPNPFHKDHISTLYKTGDLCRWLPDGSVNFLERIDAQVKIRGFRIELGEIESCLTLHEAIKNVIVIVQTNQQEKSLIAYYVLNENYIPPNTIQLRKHLLGYLPDYMIPAAFVNILAFPLTANGKLDQQALPKPVFAVSENYIAPETAFQKKIASIWADAFGFGPIGLLDNFFDLGGHSLIAARIISEINYMFHKKITIPDFYAAENLMALANVIEQTVSSKVNPIEKIEVNTALLPLSDFQLILWLSNLFEPKAKRLNIISRKRLQGDFDISALKQAFAFIFKKHEILSYQLKTLKPAQTWRQNLEFNLLETQLYSDRDDENEAILQSTMHKLLHFNRWKKHAPLLKANLFYMPNQVIELQLCMPHIISDGISMEILWNDLSRAYLLYKYHLKSNLLVEESFKHFVLEERAWMNDYAKDLLYWDNYFQDARLLTFPPDLVISNMKMARFAYSTYIEIPENIVLNFDKTCMTQHVNLSDGLCAAVAIAIKRCLTAGDFSQPIVFNLVKSARERLVYDNTIGCMLRIDPIKINLEHHLTLSDLSKKINRLVIKTDDYQHCSTFVKLASISKFWHKKSYFRKYLSPLWRLVFEYLIQHWSFGYQVLKFADRFMLLDRKNTFIVNMNLWSDFRSSKKEHAQWFGMQTKPAPMYHYDIWTIDNFLDICFLHADDENKSYIVVSSNLLPAFREKIGQEIIDLLATESIN